MTKIGLAVILASVAIAACGGGSPSASSAASCLAHALGNATPTGDCEHARNYVATPSGVGLQKPSAVSATCIRQVGNEFTCQASDGSGYSVTYDGTHIAYRQTSSP